jgi:phage baseplate assembly protein W
MFPNTQDLNVIAAEDTAATGKSFLFDFTSGDFVMRNGSLAECDGTNAIKVWIEKILRTEKGRFKIYDDTEYGCRLEDLLIGSNYSAAFVKAELKREIEDALMQNQNISAVSNFNLERTTSGILIRLEVETNDAGTNTVTVTF